jgi:hypothetical protein
MQANWSDTQPASPGNRRQHPQTRRTLLARAARVGLVAAGLPYIAACDRLPGQAARVPRVGWVANQAPTSDPRSNAYTQALVAGLGDYGYVSGQNLQMESRFRPTVRMPR